MADHECGRPRWLSAGILLLRSLFLILGNLVPYILFYLSKRFSEKYLLFSEKARNI